MLTAERDHAALREEIRTMREKVRAARPVRAGLFDVKHSAGGMMDVEFAVQYLVPVSYTHLDVYKRQSRCRTGCRD